MVTSDPVSPVIKQQTKQKYSSKYALLLLCVAIGAGIWLFLMPQGIDPRAWAIFSVFSFLLLGLILKPIAVGALTLLSMLTLVLTRVLTFQEAFSGFTNEVVWLIVLAFFIARGFIKTGLGMRVAYKLMTLCGSSTLGMAYGLVFTDWLLGGAIPSVTARAGGVIYPVVSALFRAFGSTPDNKPRRLGAYLVQTLFQCGAVTSAMFLTAMAGNPMVQSLAANADVHITWGSWALAASLPGLISLIVIPYALYKLFPPEVKRTPEAKEFAQKELEKRGKMSFQEWVMVACFSMMIILWGLSSQLAISPTVTALLGLGLLLLTEVLTWEDVLGEKSAWDTLIWFASLVAIATFLNKYGLMAWFSDNVAYYITGMSWPIGFALIALLYYYTHYFFASNIAHITSMYAPFLILSIVIGTPPALAAFLLAFFSSLFGTLTPYGSGPAPIFFGSGYVGAKDWWRLGFIISVINIVVWTFVGGAWWWLLGFYTF